MDKMKLAQAIIESLHNSPHLDECDIASHDGTPQVDAQGNITISLIRHVSGGLRRPGPFVTEMCKLTLSFTRQTLDFDAEEDSFDEPF